MSDSSKRWQNILTINIYDMSKQNTWKVKDHKTFEQQEDLEKTEQSEGKKAQEIHRVPQ